MTGAEVANAVEWDAIDLWIDTVYRDEDQNTLFEISSPASSSLFSSTQPCAKDVFVDDPFAVCFVEEPLLMELDEVISWDEDSFGLAATADKDVPTDLKEDQETFRLASVTVVSASIIPTQDTPAEDLQRGTPEADSEKPRRSLRSSLTRAARAKTATANTTSVERKNRQRKVQHTGSVTKVNSRKSKRRSYEQNTVDAFATSAERTSKSGLHSKRNPATC